MTDVGIVISEPLAQLESEVLSNRKIRELDPLDTRINTDFAYSFCSAACCRSSDGSQSMGGQDDEFLVDSGTRLAPLLLGRLTESTWQGPVRHRLMHYPNTCTITKYNCRLVARTRLPVI